MLISCSPLPGIGGVGRDKGARGFNPFSTRGITRVAGGRYPAGAVAASPAAAMQAEQELLACQAQQLGLELKAANYTKLLTSSPCMNLVVPGTSALVTVVVLYSHVRLRL